MDLGLRWSSACGQSRRKCATLCWRLSGVDGPRLCIHDGVWFDYLYNPFSLESLREAERGGVPAGARAAPGYSMSKRACLDYLAPIA